MSGAESDFNQVRTNVNHSIGRNEPHIIGCGAFVFLIDPCEGKRATGYKVSGGSCESGLDYLGERRSIGPQTIRSTHGG